MVSYVDVLTIVLMFFVGIAAGSLRQAPLNATVPVTEPAAAQAPSAELQTEPPPPEERTFSKPAFSNPSAASPTENLQRTQQRLEQQGIELHIEPEGLMISLPQAILFAPGKEPVSREALPIIRSIAEVLREIPNEIRVVGHAEYAGRPRTKPPRRDFEPF